VPTPAVPESVLMDNTDMRLKYTILVVAHLDHGGDHGPNKCSLFPRNTDDADTPVSSGRRPFSALGEVPSAKGPENTRANDEERGGSQCKKDRVRPCSVKKEQ